MPIPHISRAPRKRGRPARGTPASREIVLGAALAHFSQTGFDGTGLRDIAATAGVDAALISHKFGSKLDLWKAVVDEIANRLAEAQKDIMRLHDDTAPIEQRVREGLSCFIAANCKIPELAKFLSDEMSQPGARQDYVMLRIWQPYQAAMLPLLNDAKADGLLGESTPELTLRMLMGAIMLPLMMIRRSGDLPLSEISSLKERLVKTVLPMFIEAT
ncbi:TetR family transcriptional regulator [Acetobacter sp. TBRC 12305]|uniref:TetR/AcrR family transcriptional regulator n=1 Tax=Acetobacter garciniae TaxID=2817435 RepID=A0A939KR17_9PROT|nr:TetR/AcrR family transcriptional regulator [Acetobacter garciniae]MBX0345099.1 TetR family transcriptional regulator [Acetobacter garciniae]